MFTLETINNVAYNFAYDWLMIALTKIFVIIAVLQLVKKIPDIINTVFGTHIQSRGGIKGRLGEMAGIGGLAQKAWTSLGTGAKNLAKLGLTAPVAGAYLGADALYKKKTGKHLKDHEAFTKGKGFLFGARKALKTGSLLEGVKEYDTTSAPPTHTRAQLLETRDFARNKLSAAGVDARGSWTNEKLNADGSIVRRADGTQVFKKRNEIMDEINAGQEAYRSFYGNSAVGEKLIKSLDDSALAQIKYNDLLAVQKSGEKVAAFASDVHKTLNGNPSIYSADEITRAKEIASRLNNGERIVNSSDAEFLKKYMDETTASQFETCVKKYDDSLQTALEANEEYKLSDIVTSGALSGTIGAAKTKVDTIKEEQKDLIEKMSDADKVAYSEFSRTVDAQTSALSTTNQFNTDAPEDIVVDSTGVQRQGWANDDSWRTTDGVYDGGTGIRSSGDLGPSGTPSSSSPTSIILDSSGRPMSMPTDTSGGAPTSAPTSEEIDDRNEERWTARINELRSKTSLTSSEREELDDLTRSVQRIAARRLERSGGTSDE